MYNMVDTMYRIKIGFSIAVLVYVSGFTKRSRIFKERVHGFLSLPVSGLAIRGITFPSPDGRSTLW